jgi:hypothetical protein
MAGFFAADRAETNLEGKMAEYRKGVDEKEKEPSQTKEGKEPGMLSAKKHFKGGDGKKGGRKHSRHSSRK